MEQYSLETVMRSLTESMSCGGKSVRHRILTSDLSAIIGLELRFLPLASLHENPLYETQPPPNYPLNSIRCAPRKELDQFKEL